MKNIGCKASASITRHTRSGKAVAFHQPTVETHARARRSRALSHRERSGSRQRAGRMTLKGRGTHGQRHHRAASAGTGLLRFSSRADEDELARARTGSDRGVELMKMDAPQFRATSSTRTMPMSASSIFRPSIHFIDLLRARDSGAGRRSCARQHFASPTSRPISPCQAPAR